MSIDVAVLLKRSKVPSLGKLIRTIENLGYDFELIESIDLKKFTGYVDCKLNGEKCGFEYSYELLDKKDASKYIIDEESYNALATCSSRSSNIDFTAANIVASVLAKESGGLLIDQFGDYHKNRDILKYLSNSNPKLKAKEGEIDDALIDNMKNDQSGCWAYVHNAIEKLKGNNVYVVALLNEINLTLMYAQDTRISSDVWEVIDDDTIILSSEALADDQCDSSVIGRAKKILTELSIKLEGDATTISADIDDKYCFIVKFRDGTTIRFPVVNHKSYEGISVGWTFVERNISFEINPYNPVELMVGKSLPIKNSKLKASLD